MPDVDYSLDKMSGLFLLKSTCKNVMIYLLKKGEPTMSLRIENEKDLDFSKMEVLLHRGLKASKTVPVIVIYCVLTLVLWGLATLILVTGEFKITFSIILFYAIPVIFSPLFIITLVKFGKNKKLKHDNLYYDSKTKRFYFETFKGEIKSLDAKDEFRVGNNMVGFDETVIVYNGERIATGYTITELNGLTRFIHFLPVRFFFRQI